MTEGVSLLRRLFVVGHLLLLALLDHFLALFEGRFALELERQRLQVRDPVHEVHGDVGDSVRRARKKVNIQQKSSFKPFLYPFQKGKTQKLTVNTTAD